MRRMEMTRDLYSLNFLVKLMVLHHQILFSMATAAIAEATQMRTSAKQMLSLHRVFPRYLNLVTFPYFCLSMLISALMLFIQLVMILLMIMLFSVLTSIPCAFALSMTCAHKIDVIGKS